jgi:death-on-curing protein
MSLDDHVVIYLDVLRVLRIHATIMKCTPEQARDLLRSESALEGALARPQQYAHYEGADLPMQAAVLAHGIAETQPFLDGNKRTAEITMTTFLELNGVWLDRVTEDQLADWMLGLAHGLAPEELARRIRAHSRSFWSSDSRE